MIKIDDNMPDDLKKVIEYMNRNNLNFNTPIDDVEEMSEEDERGDFFKIQPTQQNYQMPKEVQSLNFNDIEEEEIEDFL